MSAVESLDKTARLIVMWAQHRNMFDPMEGSKPKDQVVKLMEEVGEIAAGISKGRMDDVKDGIGDAFVVLTILAELCGTTIEACAEHAYNEIKDRKGRMVMGTFVKEADL